MISYILAPEALQDLQELWDYIATENLDAADRMIATLFAAFERLATMPGLVLRFINDVRVMLPS